MGDDDVAALAGRFFDEQSRPLLAGVPDEAVALMRARDVAGIQTGDAARAQLMAYFWTLCECSHVRELHAPGDGACSGRDSYDQPCACPSFDSWTDDDTDDEG